MTVAQGIVAAVATAVVGVPVFAVLAAWVGWAPETEQENPRQDPANRPGANAARVPLEKKTPGTGHGGDRDTVVGCLALLLVVVAIVLVEVSLAGPGPDNGCVWGLAALPALMAAAAPVARHHDGTRGLALAVHASGGLTVAATSLSVAAFVTEPPARAAGPLLLGAVAAGAATTALLALIAAEITLTVVPAVLAVLVAVFGIVAHHVHDSAGYAMRYGQPVHVPLPTTCVKGERGMGCVFTWSQARHGPSPAFEDGRQVVVHFSEEGLERYGHYYRLGGFYERGDANDPNGVFLDARAVGDDAYVTVGYAPTSLTPVGRLALPWQAWAALPLLLLPLAVHLYLARERGEHPLERFRWHAGGPAPAVE